MTVACINGRERIWSSVCVRDALVIDGVAVRSIVGVSRIMRTLCTEREDMIVDRVVRRVLRVGSLRIGVEEVWSEVLGTSMLDTGGPREGGAPRSGMLVLRPSDVAVVFCHVVA